MENSELNPDIEKEAQKEKLVELKRIFDNVFTKPNKLEIYSTFKPFVEEMRAKYPSERLDNIVLYNLLASSTLPQGETEGRFDLPGGEIEEFIKNLD